MLLYSRLARHYFDIEAPGRNLQEEIRSLMDSFRREDAVELLDLGCGTGEHVNALCSEGFEVDGIDSSVQMVRVAQERFPERNFMHLDMLSMEPEKIYDGAFCIFGSFNYFLNDSDALAALSRVKRLLKPGGLFILEIWNATPIGRIRTRPISPVAQLRSQGKHISRSRGFVLLQKTPCLVQVNYVYFMAGEEMKDRHIMRAYLPREIIALVGRAGFRVEGFSSGLSGVVYNEQSNRLVLFLKAL